jgi:hypothetical protein
MIGGNVTDNGFEPWEEETNKVIAKNLIENVEKLLGGKAHYYTCCDKKTQHKRIIIDYEHGSNLH